LRILASVLLALFMMATMAVPAALVNKLLFGLLLLLLAVAAMSDRGRNRIRSFSPVIIATVFIYGYALSYLNYTDRALTNQFVLSVALLFVVYLIDWYQIDMAFLVKVAGLFLCLWTIGSIYIMVMFPTSGLGAFLLESFTEYGQGAYGTRSFSNDSLFMFRLGAAPFLFLPYCLFLDSFLAKWRVRDLLALLLVATVLVITTSRALIMACAIAMMFLILVRFRWRLRIFVAGVFAMLAAWLVADLAASTSVFSLSDAGNNAKIGHLTSFLDNLTPARMFFGQGLASYYFSTGYQAFAAHTEVTPLDMARYLGFPLTAILYAALLFPTFQRSAYLGENKLKLVLFGIYLAISLTNPVLFNSYGLLVVLWYWAGIMSASRGGERELQTQAGGL
jgi:hypothetical protein